MALYYDITKVKVLRNENTEHITTLLSSLSVYLQDIKILVKEKNHKKISEIIPKIILITDILGIDFAHDEALKVQAWGDAKGKRKEIKTTLKAMISHSKHAIKEIRKDFLG